MSAPVFDARAATGERPPLEGKVALVTGAANGIGRAAVELFARAGAKVVGCDLQPGGGVEAADATSTADMERVAALAAARHGRLDVVFACAGVGTVRDEPAGAHLTEDWVWERTIGVNLTGTFVTCRAALPHMLAAGNGGSIVTVASVYGLITGPGSPSYAASKAGVIGLTRALAVDYATHGIRANALCPGFCGTDMVFGYLDKFDDPTAARREVESSHLLDRLGLPEEIAAAALWLASDASTFVTGAAIPIDGGYTTR